MSYTNALSYTIFASFISPTTICTIRARILVLSLQQPHQAHTRSAHLFRFREQRLLFVCKIHPCVYHCIFEMQYFKVPTIAALAASVTAIQFSSPTNGSEVDLSQPLIIKWVAVSTDPTSVSIQLVNMNVNPPVSINIADNVRTSTDRFTVPAQSGLQPGNAYQFNIFNKNPNDVGILAQTQQFSITKVADNSRSSSSMSASCEGCTI
jgi:hypothetical protein